MNGVSEAPALTMAVQGEEMLQPDEVAAMVHGNCRVKNRGSNKAPARHLHPPAADAAFDSSMAKVRKRRIVFRGSSSQ